MRIFELVFGKNSSASPCTKTLRVHLLSYSCISDHPYSLRSGIVTPVICRYFFCFVCVNFRLQVTVIGKVARVLRRRCGKFLCFRPRYLGGICVSNFTFVGNGNRAEKSVERIPSR